MAPEEGKRLRIYLKVSNITIEELREKLGVSRQTIYNWFEKDALEEDVKERLRLAGIVLPEVQTKVDSTKAPLEERVAILEKEVNTARERLFQ